MGTKAPMTKAAIQAAKKQGLKIKNVKLKKAKPGDMSGFPQSTKLDPKQLFTISAISRRGIAELLRTDDGEVGIDNFHDDDPRLTDEVCKKFCGFYYNADCELEDGEYRMEWIEKLTIKKFFEWLPKKLYRRP